MLLAFHISIYYPIEVLPPQQKILYETLTIKEQIIWCISFLGHVKHHMHLATHKLWNWDCNCIRYVYSLLPSQKGETFIMIVVWD